MQPTAVGIANLSDSAAGEFSPTATKCVDIFDWANVNHYSADDFHPTRESGHEKAEGSDHECIGFLFRLSFCNLCCESFQFSRQFTYISFSFSGFCLTFFSGLAYNCSCFHQSSHHVRSTRRVRRDCRVAAAFRDKRCPRRPRLVAGCFSVWHVK